MDEAKEYPVRNQATRERMQVEFTAKIVRNQSHGRNALETGDYEPFKGYSSETFDRKFVLILELDDVSKASVQKRVIDPVKSLAQAYNIPLIYSGKEDLPPHITLQVGNFIDVTPEEQVKMQDWLRSNRSHLQLLSSSLTGLTFSMDTLVVAPNSYICSSKFDSSQGAPFRIRRAIEKIMVRAPEKSLSRGKLTPPSRYDDILHTSVARLTEDVDPKILKKFTDDLYDTVGTDLKENPLNLKVASVYMGTAADFYRNYGLDNLLK